MIRTTASGAYKPARAAPSRPSIARFRSAIAIVLSVMAVLRSSVFGPYPSPLSLPEVPRQGSWCLGLRCRENSCRANIAAPAVEQKYINPSNPERIGLRHALPLLHRQRRHRAGLLEPNICIELVRQRSIEIVARKLGLRPIDHADGALQPRIA